MTTKTYYAIVTFGSPRRDYPKYVLDLDRAKTIAQTLKGTGTCSDARVLRCSTRGDALKSDISGHHPVVFSA